MPRFALVAAIVLLSCAAEEPALRRATAPQSQAPAIQPTDISVLRERACGQEDPAVARGSLDELDCGDFLLRYGSIEDAVIHWRRALEVAKSRSEQCSAIRRMNDHALDPEEALAGVSPAVQENCKEQEARERHAELVRVQRETCLTQCESAYSSCVELSTLSLAAMVRTDCDGDLGSCRKACSAR